MPKINPVIKLSNKDLKTLIIISKSRTSSQDHIIRSKILILLSEGNCSLKVSKILKVSQKRVGNVYHRYFENDNIIKALSDRKRSGRKPIFIQEDKLLIINVACQKPKDLGYASELWVQSKLAKHIQTTFIDLKFNNISQPTISRILKQNKIKPFKIKYYITKRDPEFDSKMQTILKIYKEVQDGSDNFVTISIDEKTGLQAIKNYADDKLCKGTTNANTILRDPEYVRMGTVALLAGVNLATGEVYGETYDRHRSSEYVSFLKELDKKIDPTKTIQLIADNHIIHKSKETLRYFETCKNRFETVFIPKHGSWLNAIEGIFSKMARSFLKGIRVNSKEELCQRIKKGIEELNLERKPNNWSKCIKKYFTN